MKGTTLDFSLSRIESYGGLIYSISFILVLR